MPIARFEMPDGRIGRFEVPEGTSPEQAQQMISDMVGDQAGPRSGGEQYDAAMQKVADIKARTPEQMYGKLGPSGATWDAKDNFSSGVLQGMGDEVKAVAQGVKGMLPGGPGFSEGYDQSLGAYQAARGDYRQGNPGEALATDIAGQVLPWAIGGGALPSATLPQRMASGAVAGGVSGGLNTEGSLADRAKGAGVGAGLGAAAPVVLEGMARVIRPQTNPNVQALLDRGVTPTPGQIAGGGMKAMEDKMTSLPLVGDAIRAGQRRAVNQFNTAVYDDILAPLGINSPTTTGRDAVAAINRRLSDEFDNLLPQMEVRVDPQFGQGFMAVRSSANNLPPTELNRFTRFVQDKLAPAFANNGVADGRTMRQLRTAIQSEAAKFGRSADAYQQELGTIYGDLLETLDDAIARSNAGRTVSINGQNVDLGQRYSDLRLAWAKKLRLESAAGMQGAREGVFTPGQLSSAVKSSDQSLRKGAFARGDALMQGLSDPGKAVLGDTYPDSGTAGRLWPLLTAGGAGAVGAMNPGALAAGVGTAGVASLPYSPWGQRLAAYLMAQRPAAAGPVSEYVRRLGPVAAPTALATGR